LVPPHRLVELSAPGDDSVLALEELAERVSGEMHSGSEPPDVAPTTRTSALNPIEIAEELVAQIPHDTIVSLEGSACGSAFLQRAHRARRHWVMTNTGGAIGQGIPCAVGAAVARPDARVVCLQSDGSAQYTLQALWTLAREALNVTIIICANHCYGILQTELRRAGAQLDRPALQRLTRFDSPRLNWLSLGRGFGVPGERAATSDQFRASLSKGLKADGPFLVEAQLA
ncbi:MAG: thiamine pyrophosphate-dependent enzyme, partial [Steroidobacteraceae bacterium]